MILGAVDQPQVIVMDRLDLRIGSAGYDLYRIPPFSYIFRDLKQPVLKEQIFLGRIVPVQDKTHGQRRHCRTFNAQMRVPPIAEFLISSKIFPSHIETAHKSYPSVNDHDLPVVPVIDAKLQLAQ